MFYENAFNFGDIFCETNKERGMLSVVAGFE